MAAAGQAFLAGLGVSPEAFDTRIDTGSDSPVFRRWLGPAEVAVQVFFDPRVNLILLRNLAKDTKGLTGFLNKAVTDYVYQMQRIGVSFDDQPEPWHWRVNPLRRLGLTLWEGEPRGFMIKPFIAWPRLDFSSRELVIIKPYTKLIK